MNRGYGSSFFFNGRVLAPIDGDDEMATGVDEAVERLRANEVYAPEFRRVFGRVPDGAGLAAALASYVRTRSSPATRPSIGFVPGS